MSRSFHKPLVLLLAALTSMALIAAGCQSAAPAASPTAAKAAATSAPATTSAPAAATKAPAPATTAPAAPTTAPTAAKIDYPTKTIEMLVPFAAGGAADVAARKICAMVEKELGQSIAITNQTGAGGAVAYTTVKNSKADGYKLLWSSAAIATLPAQGNVDFDYRAFDHVAMVATETVTLAVAADAPYKNLKDFFEEAKKRGSAKPMTVGNSGVGSYTHLSAIAIADKGGVPFTHIAFGAGLAVTNLIGGHIDASVQHPAEILPALKGNQVKMLTVSANKRIDAFKDVPTLKEQGYDLELNQFRSVSVAKDTPKPIVEKLQTAFLNAAKSPEWLQYLETVGSSPASMGSEEVTKFMAVLHEQITKLASQVKAEEKKP